MGNDHMITWLYQQISQTSVKNVCFSFQYAGILPVDDVNNEVRPDVISLPVYQPDFLIALCLHSVTTIIS